jgi:PKHD-type hydroxylase
MLLDIADVLNVDQVSQCRALLDTAEWVDGRVSAGYQGALVKDNVQLAESSPQARQVGDLILAVLERHPLFISATLPAKVYPPMFNRYAGGQQFGDHIDNAVRLLPNSGIKLRTDISATLFLTAPENYEGGELLIEDTYGVHSVKLPAGHLVIYPSSSLHRVNPVLSGVRLAAFFWIQSMVRDDGQRTLLFDMDNAIQHLNRSDCDRAALTRLTGCYHNLLRMWAET